MDNIPAVVLKNLTLVDAKNIVKKFQDVKCQATVIDSDQELINEVQIAKEETTSSIGNQYEGTDVSILSGKELLSALKKARDTIVSAELLQNELETTEKTLEEIKKKSKDKESQVGGITIIGIVIGAIVGIILLQFIGAIIGFLVVGFIANIIDHNLNHDKYLERAQKYYNENYIPLDAKRNEIKDRAMKLITSSNFAEARELIPSDYFDGESADYITKFVENKRADTIKEAINLYEDHLHKNRMEEMQKQQVIAAQESAAAQQQTAEAAKQQAKSVQDIARSTRATANAVRLNTFVNIVKKR